MILFYCTSQIGLFFLSFKWKVRVFSTSSTSIIGTIFPRVCTHFVSLYHTGNSPKCFKPLYCYHIYYCNMWSAIFDVTTATVWENMYHTHIRKPTYSINIVCVLIVLLTSHSHKPPSSWAILFCETHKTEICSINSPTVASKCSGDMKSCTVLTSSQKLGMIKIHEESMVKAKKRQSVKLYMQRKSS